MGVDALVKKVLREIGVDERRYNLQWASAAEAPRFVKLITDFTAQVRDLGPLGHAEGIDPEELQAKLAKALEAVQSRKVRTGFGTATKAMRKDHVLDRDKIFEIIDTKLEKSLSSALG